VIRDTTSSRLLLGALLVGALSLAAVDSHSGPVNSPLHPVRSAAATLFAPVESGLVFLARPVTGTVSAVGNANDRNRRIEALSRQNIALSAQLRAALRHAADTEQIARLTEVGSAAGASIRPAHVIGVDPDHAYSATISVDVGARDGVAANTAVLDAAGLIGRVTTVYPTTATVLLLTDPLSSVGVRVASTGEIGTLDGARDGYGHLRMFDPHAHLRPGDKLVTFGSPDGQPYPAGLPVGEVVAVQPGTAASGPVATVRPYSRFGTLDAVGVIVPHPVAPAVRARGAVR
jgi:rod shape-determining protein MreC